MANQPEKRQNSVFDHLTTVRTTDRVTQYLMQQLGIQDSSEPIVLTPEEELRLAQIRQSNERQRAVKSLADEILLELPNVTEDELKQILSSQGINEPELVQLAINHCSHQQIFREVKPVRFTNPETIELLRKLGFKTE